MGFGKHGCKCSGYHMKAFDIFITQFYHKKSEISAGNQMDHKNWMCTLFGVFAENVLIYFMRLYSIFQA